MAPTHRQLVVLLGPHRPAHEDHQGIDRLHLQHVCSWHGEIGRHTRLSVVHQVRELKEALLEADRNPLPPPAAEGRIGPGDDDPGAGRHQFSGTLGCQPQGMADEMARATLPAYVVQHGGDCGFEPFLPVTRRRRKAGQSSSDETAQEGQPEGSILTQSHIETQDLMLELVVEANHGPRLHRAGPSIVTHLQIGRIKPDRGELP